MPDINIQGTLTVTKSSSTLQGVGSWDITQQTSTKRNASSIHNVTATPATLPIGSVNPLGYLFVKNLGAVNVTLGVTSGGNLFATIRPNEFCLIPAAANPFAWTPASTNADVMVVAAES